ncbi:MAG: nucleotide-binding universal stress UspA family protein [Lysobacterales bacterium]|jgi:nucleotide-binding universal stress UspA family protein
MSLIFLVGVDCSTCGSRALDYATQRALVSGASLLIAHVIEWSPFSFSTPQENEERHLRREEEIKRAEDEIINPILSQLSEQGVNAHGAVRHGHVAETLLILARENEVSNIMIGRHGSSRLEARLFGSVANTLVQIADRPVTVVP